MQHIPSDAEVVRFVQEQRREEPHVGFAKLFQRMHKDTQTRHWVLSEKRLKTIMEKHDLLQPQAQKSNGSSNSNNTHDHDNDNCNNDNRNSATPTHTKDKPSDTEIPVTTTTTTKEGKKNKKKKQTTQDVSNNNDVTRGHVKQVTFVDVNNNSDIRNLNNNNNSGSSASSQTKAKAKGGKQQKQEQAEEEEDEDEEEEADSGENANSANNNNKKKKKEEHRGEGGAEKRREKEKDREGRDMCIATYFVFCPEFGFSPWAAKCSIVQHQRNSSLSRFVVHEDQMPPGVGPDSVGPELFMHLLIEQYRAATPKRQPRFNLNLENSKDGMEEFK